MACLHFWERNMLTTLGHMTRHMTPYTMERADSNKRDILTIPGKDITPMWTIWTQTILYGGGGGGPVYQENKQPGINTFQSGENPVTDCEWLQVMLVTWIGTRQHLKLAQTQGLHFRQKYCHCGIHCGLFWYESVHAPPSMSHSSPPPPLITLTITFLFLNFQ